MCWGEASSRSQGKNKELRLAHAKLKISVTMQVEVSENWESPIQKPSDPAQKLWTRFGPVNLGINVCFIEN